MKKFLKWLIIGLLAVIIITGLASLYLSNKFMSGFEKTYSVTQDAIPILSDSASLVRGKILTVSCKECHGNDFGGKAFFDDPTIGYIPSSNLTKGKGSQTENYADLDWVRAIRHGVNPKGNALIVMPAEVFSNFSDEDLGSVIGYIKTMPGIERKFDTRHFNFTAKVMAGAGLFGEVFPYNSIDHTAVNHVASVPKSSDLNYGKYMMNITGCQGCHGKELNGGPGHDPTSPWAPNITKGGNLGKWNFELFKAAMREGKTPEGKPLDAKFMPWAGIAVHEDVEIEALYNYIVSFPAKADAPQK